MPRINVKEILTDNNFLVGQNANIRSYHKDIADFCLPRKSWITSIRTKGERVKFNFLYDSTAIRSVRNASSGFYSNLTNPATRWFALETRNKKLMEDLEVRKWFREVENNLLSTLDGSNFYNIIQEFFLDYICFGTATFLMLPDVQDGVRFISTPVEQINRVEDGRGRLNEIYRNFRLTARQAINLWGGNAGRSVNEAVIKKPFQEFEFVHYVGPRHERDEGKTDALNMPFKSVWIAKKDEHLINESGFMSMPYISEVFYRDSSDPNGFSPTMDVFADIKLANAVKRTLIRKAMKDTDPPLNAPAKGYVLPLNFNPAGMNYRDPNLPTDSIATMPTGPKGSFVIGKDFLEMIQNDIRDGLFVTLFQSLNAITKQMPIIEVQKIIADNMSLLGPVINRATNGALGPTIINLFNMKIRNNELPPAPEILEDQEFAPIYLSPLAKAQRSSEIGQVEAFMADVQAIGGVLPNAYDKVDEDKTIDLLAKMRGVSSEIMRDDEIIERMRAHRAEQDALIAQLQAGQGIASAAKDGAQAEKAMAEASGGKS